MADIIMAFWDEEDITIRAIESVINTAQNIRFIMIDNGSHDAASRRIIDYLGEKNQRFIYHRFESNQGFSRGYNLGIKLSDSSNIILMNNDIVCVRDWLYRLEHCANAHATIGVLGLLTDTGRLQNYRKYWGEIPYPELMIYQQKEALRQIRSSCVPFSCVLIKRAVINKIGYLDEDFSPCLGEDDDFCDRARLAGFETAILLSAFVYHAHRTSVHKLENFEEIAARNRALYAQKYRARRSR
jgi:GT2 family glycosyltransferase